MFQDFRFAFRLLARRPAFTLIAVATLALGLGASATVFTYVDVAHIRQLPVKDPDTLLLVENRSKERGAEETSYLDYRDYRDQNTVFTDVALYGERGAILDIDGDTDSIRIEYVSGNYFQLMGVRAAIGRTLLPEDDSPRTTTGTVVIGYGLWQQRFAGKNEVVGKSIRLNDASLTVVGVAPPHFHGLDRFSNVAVWVPINARPLMLKGNRDELENRGSRWSQMVARLRPGVTIEQANSQLATIASRLAASYPARNQGMSATASWHWKEQRQEELDNNAYLLAMIGLVLLIACANVANLLLGHADSRRREFAVRLAMGAGRGPLLRQVLAESLLLSLAGAAFGIILSVWLTTWLGTLLPASADTLRADLAFDGRVLLFVLFASVICALIFGILPAIQASGQDLVPALKNETRAGRSWLRLPLRSVLVVAQIAVSLALMFAAGLLVKSLLHSRAIRPGFDVQRNIAYFHVVPAFQGYSGERLNAFYEEYRQRLQALPGVRQATYAARVPLDENGWARSAAFVIPGYQPPDGNEAINVLYTMVGPNYFNTFGTQLRSGRPIDEHDTASSLPVAVINETMARQFWPRENPIGRSVLMGRTRRVVQIVGVAEDARVKGLYEDPRPYLFVAMSQVPEGEASYAIETSGDPAPVVAAARAELRNMERGAPVLGVASMSEVMRRILYEQHMAAWLAASLALLGLLLGAIGLYGVAALAAARRTREVAIRMALGATRRSVFALIIPEGLRLAILGIAIGGAGSVIGTRYIASQLHGVSRFDPGSFLLVALLLLAVAALASFVPARRAASVDPNEALRYE